MFNKFEKKYLWLKILIGLAVVFAAATFFINPKPSVEHIEKPLSLPANAQ